MSINFHANQYENAFKTLKNWEVPKGCSRYPSGREGFTQIRATDRGHLMTGVPRSRASPWGDFIGTWDMPLQIPGNHMMNGTARTELAVDKLQRMKTEGDVILSGKLKHTRVPPALRMKDDIDAAPKAPTPKSASPKSASPKVGSGRASASGRLREGGAVSGVRSGAQNPIPAAEFSPQSVEWPEPGASRMEKPISPAPCQPSAETMAAQAAANMHGSSPEPELQGIDPVRSPGAEPVNWHMPKSTEPYRV